MAEHQDNAAGTCSRPARATTRATIDRQWPAINLPGGIVDEDIL
jgi:hypothetical protein